MGNKEVSVLVKGRSLISMWYALNVTAKTMGSWLSVYVVCWTGGIREIFCTFWSGIYVIANRVRGLLDGRKQ